MGILAKVCVLVALCEISAADHYRPFDCRRPGIACKNDKGQKGACQLSGNCACPNTAFQGDNCGLEGAKLKASGCALKCGTNGRCYTEGTEDKCWCQTGYYGINCERKRVDVLDCTGGNMRVNVNPFGSFKGKIYLWKLSKTSACVFTPVANSGDVKGYEINLSLSNKSADNPCASQLTQNSTSSSYNIIVQHNADYLTHTDEKHTVTCSDGGSVGLVGTVISSGGLEKADLDGLTGTDITQISLDVPVRMQVVEEASKNLVTSVITVGDRLILQLTLEPPANSGFEDFFVDSCSSSSQDIRAPLNGTLLRQKVLLLDRCPVEDAKDVISGEVTKTGSTVSIPFRGFKFEDFDSLFMSCSVKLCQSSNRAECLPVTCGLNGASGFGRKRRQAIEESDKVNVTRRVFVVTLGDYSLMGRNFDASRIVEKEPCTQSVAFVATAVVFGVVLVIALAAALALCLRTHRMTAVKRVPGKA